MGRYHDKALTLFTGLAYGLGMKRRPTTIPLSKSIGSPAPQTSLSTSFRFRICSFESNVDLFHPVFAVFELPDELILSILLYTSPDPRLTGHYTQFSTRDGMATEGYSDQWHQVEFLRPLSMTCRAMRLRLLPWVWERLEMHPNNWTSRRNYA